MKLKKLILVLLIFSKIDGIAQNFEWIATPIYDSITPFHEGIAAVKLNGEWGYINEQGEVILKSEYDLVYNFNNNAGVVTLPDNTIVAIVDSHGSITRPSNLFKIDKRFPLFSDGLLLVTDGLKWGYLNKSGKLAIPCKYYYAKPFSEGLAGVVFDDSGWYYINVNNQVVIPPIKNEVRIWVSGFSDGKAFVIKKDGLTCMDLNGNKAYNDIPSLSPPNDYSKKNLRCKEGEIILDDQNKVNAIVEKSGKIYRYMSAPSIITRSDGQFVFDGNVILYSDQNVFWNTHSSATVNRYGKTGIIKISNSPSVNISLATDMLNSIFGNDAELKLTMTNNLTVNLNSISVKIDGTLIQELPVMPAYGSKDLYVNIPKQNDLSTENKEIGVSVYAFGLLLAQHKYDLQIKDVPSLRIVFPKDEYHIQQGETFPVTFNVLNESAIDAKDVNINIKDANGHSLFTKIIDIMPNDKCSETIFLKGNIGGKASPGTVKQIKQLSATLKHPKTPVVKSSKSIGVYITIPEPPTKTPVDTKTNKQVITN